jgi:osmoprotectant transport system permease protein
VRFVASAGLFGQWISANEGRIGSLLWQHIELSLIAVAVGGVIAIPLGVLIWKVRWLRPPVMSFAGVLYVVPSVALLTLVAPLTGFFSITTAEVALVSYTLLILLRNTVTGLDSISAEVHDAAEGMGYSPWQELMRVQLPLALPSILAGARVATVTVVGLVNVTAFIGQGGLGQFITEGFSYDFETEIAVALVLSVVLAGAADAAIVGLQRLVVPWLHKRELALR